MERTGEVIETTVAELAAELARRGVEPHRRVTVTIEGTEDGIVPGRRAARLAVSAAGLSDADLDRLIELARDEAAAPSA